MADQTAPEETPAPPVLTYRDQLHALAGAPDHLLDLPMVMHVVAPEDVPAGSIMFLPVASIHVLNERIYDTPEGLCAASQLTPEQFHADLPVAFEAGHPVMTNLSDEEVNAAYVHGDVGYDPDDTY